MSWAFDDLTFYELTFDELGYWAIDVAPLFLSEWYSVFSPPLEERKTFGKCLGSNPDPFANHGSACTLVYDGASSWQHLRNTKERKSRPCHLNYLDAIRPMPLMLKNCALIVSLLQVMLYLKTLLEKMSFIQTCYSTSNVRDLQLDTRFCPCLINKC